MWLWRHVAVTAKSSVIRKQKTTFTYLQHELSVVLNYVCVLIFFFPPNTDISICLFNRLSISANQAVGLITLGFSLSQEWVFVIAAQIWWQQTSKQINRWPSHTNVCFVELSGETDVSTRGARQGPYWKSTTQTNLLWAWVGFKHKSQYACQVRPPQSPWLRSGMDRNATQSILYLDQYYKSILLLLNYIINS